MNPVLPSPETAFCQDVVETPVFCQPLMPEANDPFIAEHPATGVGVGVGVGIEDVQDCEVIGLPPIHPEGDDEATILV